MISKLFLALFLAMSMVLVSSLELDHSILTRGANSEDYGNTFHYMPDVVAFPKNAREVSQAILMASQLRYKGKWRIEHTLRFRKMKSFRL